MGAFVPLNFFEWVPVLDPPCCVDSQPQGQTLLCMCVCVYCCMSIIYISVGICLVGSIIFRLVLFVQYILHQLHPGILKSPLEFCSAVTIFAGFGWKAAFAVMQPPAGASSPWLTSFIHYSVLTSSFLSHETRSIGQKKTTFWFAKSKMVVGLEVECEAP